MSEVRLIDANALLERVRAVEHEVYEQSRQTHDDDKRKELKGAKHELGMFQLAIQLSSTIDAEPVIHAHWNLVVERVGGGYCSCSHCSYHTLECVNYCQNCGAKMDEVTK